MRTAKTLIRLSGCPGWSESLLCVHAILLVLSWGGSYNKEYDWTVQHHKSNIWVGILFFDYPFKINECCCHAALFLWQLQHFMNTGCLSNTVVMTIVTFVFTLMADYPFKINKFCCHAALFLWQLQHFMNMGCLSNTVAMATVTRFFLKHNCKFNR